MTALLRSLGATLLVVLMTSAHASATGNTVASSRAGRHVRAITANDLKPAECATLSLTTVVTGSVSVTGTDVADLIAGSALVDLVNGRPGNDCILGGDGGDSIDGGSGTDVCIGGPGIDSFTGCETAFQ